tara:strand:+ start:410 stop:3343 length:2934 start_codon:yes stop_codon:yes gene_type:complete
MNKYEFNKLTNSGVLVKNDNKTVVLNGTYTATYRDVNKKEVFVILNKYSSELLEEINVIQDQVLINGSQKFFNEAEELYLELDSLGIFFLDNNREEGNTIDGDVYFNSLFEVEKDAQGNIIKTKSIYDFQVPPESIEVGEAIKISDLGQSLSYSTKFDSKQYLLMGYEINNSGSQRPFVKQLEAPTSFEVQPFFGESQTYTTQKSFPIVSFQDVIGKTYNLKVFTSSVTFRIRLIRRATNGGEDTITVDETIPGTQTNINGFDFDLSPITDFTINTNYDFVLSVEDGDTFDVLGSSDSGAFLPYIKRQFGWEYTKKDLAYLEDIQGFISSSEKGQPNGLAPLNDQGKIDAQYIDVDIDGGIEIIGYWDANTNTPDLSSMTLEKGQGFQVSNAGDTTLNGYTTWNEFDLALWGDNILGNWVRVVSTEKVLSVNGKKGDVVINKSDIGLGNADNTSDQDKPVSDATISALASKIDVNGNITELNNDAGYITLEDIPEFEDNLSLYKAYILNGIPLTSLSNFRFEELSCIGSLDFSQGAGWSSSSNGISVPSDGVYEISVSVGFIIPSGQRVTPIICPYVNGVEKPFYSNSGYIRGTSSIFRDSCILTVPLQLSAGDVISLGGARSNSVTSSCLTNSDGSFISIKQISKPSLEGVSSSSDLSDFDMSTEQPSMGQIPRWNGFNFIPSNENGGGGGSNVEIIDKEVNISQNAWSGNTNNLYSNISIPGVKVGQLCIIYPSPQVWQIIQANGATWDGYAYCISPGLVTAVCRVSSYITLPNGSFFSIKVVEKISTFANLFSEPIKQEIDVYTENITVEALDHDKHFNILSPLNYSVVLPSLSEVDSKDIYKFKNLNDSTLKGTFVPVYGEKIENNSTFELFGRGTLSIRKKYNNNGAFWSILEISNLFDHINQGKTKELSFIDHLGSLNVVHNRSYRPIVKVYVSDDQNEYSEAEVDIDHNNNLNEFTVNLEGINSGYVRYV